MNFKKQCRNIIAILFISVFFCSLGLCATLVANDIPDDHWAWKYINIAFNDEWAYVKNNKFKPDEPATREHVAYMIVEVWDEASKNNKTYKELSDELADISKFKDANTLSLDVANQFKKAVQNGIFQGYDNNTIRPTDNITRAEVATLLTRIANIPKDNTKKISFKDELPEWAEIYISNAIQMGLMQGDDKGLFRAEDDVTYAEIVTVLMRWAYGEDYKPEENNDVERLQEYKHIYEVTETTIPYKAVTAMESAKDFIENSLTYDYKELEDNLKDGPKAYTEEVEETSKQECQNIIDDKQVQQAAFTTNDKLVKQTYINGEKYYIVRGTVQLKNNTKTETKDIEVIVKDGMEYFYTKQIRELN